jgi:hypothetical protein
MTDLIGAMGSRATLFVVPEGWRPSFPTNPMAVSKAEKDRATRLDNRHAR